MGGVELQGNRSLAYLHGLIFRVAVISFVRDFKTLVFQGVPPCKDRVIGIPLRKILICLERRVFPESTDGRQ